MTEGTQKLQANVRFWITSHNR